MSRRRQIMKEIILTILLYIFYFVWWYYFAYIYTDSENVANFKYILGLPEWFFFSCVLGLFVINFLVFIVVNLFFKEIDFEGDNK